MAFVLIMPRQGNTVESCVLQEWSVKEGDAVDTETTVCTVETDKAAFEIPAGEKGTVLKLLCASGDDVPVLDPIAVIGDPGEDWAAALEKAGKSAPQAQAVPESPAVQTAPAAKEAASSAVSAEGNGTASSGAASPRAKNLAKHEGLSLEGIPGSGPEGRVIERDVQAALGDRPGMTAAAKASAAGGAKLPSAGSGIGGRVTLGDMSAASTSVYTEAASSMSAVSGEGAVTETPIKGIRKLISDRMSQSLAESAQFTLNMDAGAVKLEQYRARLKASDESLGLSKISINDLILFAVSRTLPRFSFMNAHKTGDILKTFERVHLGMAVDTPRGLMVPVIRNANLLSLAQISAEAKRLAAACQGGGITPDELGGSTFTVTNLGGLGIRSFTPVLNAPEVGILGVCNIELKPVSKNGEVVFEPHIGFSLTINHQVVDGAPAARFLKGLADTIANIDLWLAF